MVLTDHPEDTIACLSAAVQIVFKFSRTQYQLGNLCEWNCKHTAKSPHSEYGAIYQHQRHQSSVSRQIHINQRYFVWNICENDVGTVIRVSGIRSLVQKMAFKCIRCESVMQVVFFISNT